MRIVLKALFVNMLCIMIFSIIYINIAKEEEKLLLEINKRRNSLKQSFNG